MVAYVANIRRQLKYGVSCHSTAVDERPRAGRRHPGPTDTGLRLNAKVLRNSWRIVCAVRRMTWRYSGIYFGVACSPLWVLPAAI
ncbi:hypothetical protein BDW66DRAFT_129229 [Aspergillus desertorum]